MKKGYNDKNPYEDIINLQHHVSSEHAHMPLYDRAAQFSPFAALTGFDGAIKETSRFTDKRIELDETEKNILDEKLRIVQENSGINIENTSLYIENSGMYSNNASGKLEVEFVFFCPDELKTGGAYISVRGIVKKIDKYERVVILQDGTRIPIEEIVDITGEMFQSVDDYI